MSPHLHQIFPPTPGGSALDRGESASSGSFDMCQFLKIMRNMMDANAQKMEERMRSQMNANAQKIEERMGSQMNTNAQKKWKNAWEAK